MKAKLLAIADALDNTPRLGSEQDDPEGSRYIQISDSIALGIAVTLREAADNIHDIE